MIDLSLPFVLPQPIFVGWVAIAGAVASALAQRYQNRKNKSETAYNRRYQERMSNTAHVREVRDLLDAGLNPILSANSGASTPSGNVAPQSMSVSEMTNSAKSANETKQQVELFNSQKELLDQQARLSSTQAQKTLLEQSNVEQQNALLRAQTIGSEQENAQKAMYLDYLQSNPTVRDTGYLMQSLGLTGNSAVSNAAALATPFLKRKSTTDDDIITHRRDGSVTHKKSTTRR